MSSSIPRPDSQTSQIALRAMLRSFSMMPALEVFHAGLGDVFRLPMPGFSAVIVAGPTANRQVLVTHADQFAWRNDRDPVARLLGHGMLVEDGLVHDQARDAAYPALHRRAVAQYLGAMIRHTDAILDTWGRESRIDSAVEMRKVTLNVVMETLFRIDFQPEMARLWRPLLRLLRYISPGLWMLWPEMPQPGAERAKAHFDQYLFAIIRARRNQPDGDDLLGLLIRNPILSDEEIRDQMMTMIIAGHDTIAALLAWAVHILSQRPDVQARAHSEILSVLGDGIPTMAHIGQLTYLGQVIDETLRMYPPAHLGNRRVLAPVEIAGVPIEAGERVGYSIYLSHRHPEYWPDAYHFDPDRFAQRYTPFSYVPFGGGERTCIGMNYALLEAKLVLLRLLQRYELLPVDQQVRQQMAVTLVPRTRGGGAFVRVRSRG